MNINNQKTKKMRMDENLPSDLREQLFEAIDNNATNGSTRYKGRRSLCIKEIFVDELYRPYHQDISRCDEQSFAPQSSKGDKGALIYATKTKQLVAEGDGGFSLYVMAKSITIRYQDVCAYDEDGVIIPESMVEERQNQLFFCTPELSQPLHYIIFSSSAGSIWELSLELLAEPETSRYAQKHCERGMVYPLGYIIE